MMKDAPRAVSWRIRLDLKSEPSLKAGASLMAEGEERGGGGGGGVE